MPEARGGDSRDAEWPANLLAPFINLGCVCSRRSRESLEPRAEVLQFAAFANAPPERFPLDCDEPPAGERSPRGHELLPQLEIVAGLAFIRRDHVAFIAERRVIREAGEQSGEDEVPGSSRSSSHDRGAPGYT